jgi:hypothetical protein
VDVNKCREVCALLLEQFPTTLSWGNVLCTDECVIYHNTYDQNVVFWLKENTHFTL